MFPAKKFIIRFTVITVKTTTKGNYIKIKGVERYKHNILLATAVSDMKFGYPSVYLLGPKSTSIEN
jgi:hypothetical protein